MPLARDLNDLIHRYGGAIAAGAESVPHPRHSPGGLLPDLSAIEKCRSKATGKPFTFYPSQQEKVAGTLAGLKANGGLDKCHLAFYRDGDIGKDEVWDNWRLEGPGFAWYFRGEPHVHVWVNVAGV